MTEEDFLITCEFAKFAEFINMHIFPYSERPGTVAAELDNKIPKAERKRRVARLGEIRDAVKAISVKRLSPVGSVRRVLIETELEDGSFTAHGADFVEYSVRGDGIIKGEFAKVLVKDHEEGVCISEIIR